MSQPEETAAELTARALAGLVRVAEPPAAAIVDLAAAVGPIEAWAAVRYQDHRTAGAEVMRLIAPRMAGRSPDDLDARAKRDLGAAEAVGARLIGPTDPEWPAGAFDGLGYVRSRPGVAGAPPVGLYVKGIGLPAVDRSVAVVGSRAATPYGVRVATELAAELVASGMTVVSGGAYGIDAAAHRGALHAGRAADQLASVAVLACGIDRPYPLAHAGLLDAIAATGCVVSEYPPGTTPARYRFLVRNRLIAALAVGTLVVEAGARSGSLNTAAAADLLSRHTMAMPGPVTSAVSLGCHDLIRNRNATLVTGARDVIATVGPLRPEVADLPPADATARPLDALAPAARLVYEALPARGWATTVDIAVEAAVPARAVLATLAVLEVEGLIERADGGWRRAR